MPCRAGWQLWFFALIASAGVQLEAHARRLAAPDATVWLRAESAHVIVQGKLEEDDLRAFTRRLERFHALLESQFPGESAQDPRKLDVYLLQGRADLRRAMAGAERDVAGLYRATPNGMLVLAIARRPNDREGDDVLFHEYTHHFMGQRELDAVPAWLSEGYAEYYSTADVEGERIEIGKPNSLHAQVLLNQPWISFDEVLTGVPWQMTLDTRTAFYAQSWLLTHYLLRNPERWAATREFLLRTAAGVPPVQAFEESLGMTLVQLQLQLQFYLRLQLRHTEVPDTLPEPQVAVTRLPGAVSELMLPALSLLVGSTDTATLTFLRDAPTRFPDDAFAREAAARAALATAEPQRALALLAPLLGDAATPEQLHLAGTAQMARAQSLRAAQGASGDAAEDAYIAAGNLFARALRADPDDFRSLYRYWQVRQRNGEPPDANLQQVLLRAHELAPQVQEIGLATARMLLAANRAREAREVLAGVATDPHGSELSSLARKLIASIDAARAGTQAGADAMAGEHSSVPVSMDGAAVNVDAASASDSSGRSACAAQSTAGTACN